MNKVYIVQDTGKNFLPAADFGEIEILLPKSKNNNEDYPQILEYLGTRLADIDESDYLILTGDPIVMGLATWVAMSYLGALNLLKWNHTKYKYEEVTINDRE